MIKYNDNTGLNSVIGSETVWTWTFTYYLWCADTVQTDYERSRARYDREEKLIISAWYNMVSEETHRNKGINTGMHRRLIWSLCLRGWLCIRGCPVSAWAPLTRPCPSSPSSDNPPTWGEPWCGNITDKSCPEYLDQDAYRLHLSSLNICFNLHMVSSE